MESGVQRGTRQFRKCRSAPAPGAAPAWVHPFPTNPSAPTFLEVREVRREAEQPKDRHTTALSGKVDRDSNQAAGIGDQVMPPQGTALDTRLLQRPPPQAVHSPSAPRLSRAGFRLEGRLPLLAAPCLEQPLRPLQTGRWVSCVQDHLQTAPVHRLMSPS